MIQEHFEVQTYSCGVSELAMGDGTCSRVDVVLNLQSVTLVGRGHGGMRGRVRGGEKERPAEACSNGYGCPPASPGRGGRQVVSLSGSV